VIQDRVADGLQRRGVMKELAEDERLLDLAGGVRLAQGLETLQRLPDGSVVGQIDAGQTAAQEVAVLGGHPGPVGRVRTGGMGGVADDGSPALRPLLGGLAVPQHPALHVGRIDGGDQLWQRHH
jgi:hypothetical protein